MTDSEWLRGIIASGWNDDLFSPEVKALFRRAADGLDELKMVKAELAAAKAELAEMCNTANLALEDRNEVMEIVRSNIRKGGN